MVRKTKARPAPTAADFPPEARRAEVATIGWLLCALFTFCSEGVGLIAKLILSQAGEWEAGQNAWRLLPDITLAIGVVTGTLCLMLTPLVYRLRKTPPPSAITAIAVLVGLTPWAGLLLRWLHSA